MSEKRDLWVPAIVALLGMGLGVWHMTHGQALLGVGALLVGWIGAFCCLPLRVRHGQNRVLEFGLGVTLLLAAWIPGAVRAWPDVLAWFVAGTAFLVPIRSASMKTRTLMLIAALGCVLFAMLCISRTLPTSWMWLMLSLAIFFAMQVWFSRPQAEPEVVLGPRVCVYGGSFDPYHDGHRALAEAALRYNDRLLVVVAGAAPHKFVGEEGDDDGPLGTPFHHRVAMTRLGVEGLPRTEVLEMEGRRAGPSYTVDTLQSLVRRHAPGTRFRLLVGADMYQDFATWKDWERILDMAQLLVAARPGYELTPPAALRDRNDDVLALSAPELNVSSTAIRKALEHDEEPVGLPPNVRAYIRDHGLYGSRTR